MQLTEEQKAVARMLRMSDADFTAAHDRRNSRDALIDYENGEDPNKPAKRLDDPDDMKKQKSRTETPRRPERWGDTGKPEVRFESHPEVFSERWPRAAKRLDEGTLEEGDRETDMSADELAEQAMNHLAEYRTSDEDPAEKRTHHLTRALHKSAMALEQHLRDCDGNGDEPIRR